MANRDCDREVLLEQFKSSTPIFLALGDVNRQQIIMLLLESHSLNVSQITEKMELSRPAISHHLKILRQAGLIDFEKSGKEKYYSLSRNVIQGSFKHIRDLIMTLENAD